MGITTVRDVGGYDDLLVEARQAMRYGAFAGPRVLACGRIVSADRARRAFFPGMYREADGADEIRKAVREQMRYGADFIKVMTTGARSVELEDPDPAQLTREEIEVLVEEAHRMGFGRRPLRGHARHGIAIEEGVDTIEHGMYLTSDPTCSSAWRARARCSCRRSRCLYGIAGLGERIGTSPEDEEYQGGAARRRAPPMPTWTSSWSTSRAQRRAGRAHDPGRARAGVTIAMGFDCGPAHRHAPSRRG